MVTAAVASNVWGAYEKAGRAANLTTSPSKTPMRQNGDLKDSSLRHIIMDCEEGRAGQKIFFLVFLRSVFFYFFFQKF